MKAGRTLQDLAVEIDRQAKAKRDFIVSTNSMLMEDGAELFSLHHLLDSGMREVTPFGMTDLFHRQLGTALGIPAKYYDVMRMGFPELLTQNVNGWLGRKDIKHTIRTLDNTARAFLSNRYRRIDNYEVAEAVLPVISEMQDARVESCEVTENKMYLKIVNPRLEADVVPGDTVQAGIVISNSEVGLGSVSVMPLLYRLVCSNGMVVNDLGKRKYHIGREKEESWELFSDETLQADDNAFMMKLTDIVRSAVDGVRFNTIVDKLRESVNAKITAPVIDVVELMGRQYGFTKNENDGILQHLITGGDLSLYGLSNAVTRTASNADSYDRASDLERIGWDVATMPAQIWKQINEL